MRVLITVPPALWEQLRRLAEEEYRTPRQQLELLVHQALRVAVEAQQEKREREGPRAGGQK